MKFYRSLALLASMSFVVASGQQVSTVKQTVKTIAKGKTVSVTMRQVRVVKAPVPAKLKVLARSSSRRLSTTGESAGSVGTKIPVVSLPVGKKVHPDLFPGYPNATISSQNFPTTAVGQTSAPVTVTFPFPPGGNYQELSFAGNSNAFAGQATCSSTACSAPIYFEPNYPGLTKDAIISKDANGNVLYETLIYGIGTAPQFGYDLGGTTIHNSVTSQPGSIAVGPDGSIYLTDASEDAVIEIASDFSSQSQLSITGLGSTGGVAVDGAGTIYVADKTNNAIVSYNPQGGQATISTSTLSNPSGLAVNGAGLLFIADTGNGRIIAIDNQGGETTVASGLSSPTSLAVDAAGDLFYVDAGNGGEVTEIPVENNPISIATQQGTLYDMAVDAAGRLYISTPGGDTLISPDGTIQEYGGGPNYGMALDQAGDVLLSQPAQGSLLSINRSVSNFILSTEVDTTTSGGDTISNTGNAALMLSNIAITGGTVFLDDDSDQCFAGLTLQPAQTCNTLVDFSPTAARSYTESYTVTSNSLYTTTTTDVDTLYGNGIGAATSTGLSISPSPAMPGQGVTFTAAVNQQGESDLPAPTGTVTFLDGTTVLGSGTISGNTAMYATANLTAGTHSITAMYAGDNYNMASTSAAQNLLVTAGNTSTTLLVSTPASPVAGQTVTFTVDVNGATQTTVATGTVAITNGGVTLATITLDDTGQGSFNTAYFAPGNYSVTANYSGDATYDPSTSGVDSFTVAPAAAPSFVSNIGTPLAAQSVGVLLAAAGTVQSVQVLTQGVTGLDFTMASDGTCATGTAYTAGQYCTVSVVFNPQYAGTRSGAVLLLGEDGSTIGITYLQGSGTGPQIIYGAGTQTVLGGGFSSPSGLGLDGAGNVYVADLASGTVKEVSPGCASASCVATLASGFMYPDGLFVDGAGNVFFADFSNSTDSSSSSSDGLVVEIPFGCISSNCFRTLGSEFDLPDGIAVDTSGNVFVADWGDNAVEELMAVNGVVPDSPTTKILAGGFSGQTGPDGLTLDASGNVFVTNHDNGHALYEIPFAGGYSTLNTISASFTAPEDVTFDGTGNAYVVDEDTNSLYELPATNGSLSAPPTINTLAANFDSPEAVAVDGLGNVYVSDYGNQRVVKIDYSDPTGLNFATTTTVGSTDTMDGPQKTTVRNNGNAALSFTAFAASTNFTVDSETTTCSTTVSLAAGASCVVGVDFAPTAAGPLSGTLTLTDNAQNVAGAVQSIPLTGTGVAGSTLAAPSVTTLVSTPAAPTVGQSVTFTVSVSGTSQSTPTPTGTVTLMNTAVTPASVLGTVTLSGGSGTFSTTTLAAGTYTVTATYSGDSVYAASTSGADTFTVSPAAAALATTTSLSASAGTVAYKTPVTLSSKVTGSNDSTVLVGQVIFCDATATRCTPAQNVGLAQLTANNNGAAVLKLAPGTIGIHSYKAIFLGTTSYAASTSATQAVAVTGTYPTTTTIAATRSQGDYGLTGTVVGLGPRAVSPTGTVSFNDTTSSPATVLATAALGVATPGFNEGQATGSPFATGSSPNGVASGDFNGDGLLDLAVVNTSGGDASTVSVLMGNGDGTFKPQVNYPVGLQPASVQIADFNGDGVLDLVVANANDMNANGTFGTVGVLLGNGDGTFQPQVTYQCNSPQGIGVADLNHDGFPDIVAGNVLGATSTLSVLLNNGDGTFQPPVAYATGGDPNALVEGDFNGDGNVDVAVANGSDGTVSVLIGNGDGTFKPQVTYTVGAQDLDIKTGDFNGDGFEDLAVANETENAVGVLLGNGDGTFQATVSYPANSNPGSLAVGDFNDDGIQDIAVVNYVALTESTLLGNGDGTFQEPIISTPGNFPGFVTTGDFNGDGYPDLAITTNDSNYNGAVAILLSEVTQTATATVSGIAPTGPGTHQVEASYPGDANFGKSVSQPTPLLGVPVAAASTTTLTIAPVAPTLGQNVSFSVAVTSASPANAVPTGTVTLINTAVTPNAVLGTITLGTAGTGTFSTSSLAAATYNVVASYSGDTNYLASMSAASPLVVGKDAQTITFGALSNQTYGVTPVTLAATASSLLAVSYAVTGPATVTGSTLTITGAGVVTVTASQTGNATYAAATAVSQSFTVAQAVLTATANHASRNFGVANPAFTYAITGFVYADTAAVVGGSATLSTAATATSDAGTYPITFATKALTATNYSFNYVGGTLTVLGGVAQTITFPAVPNHAASDAPFMLSATSSSGLPVSYAVTAGPATVSVSTVTLTGAGTVTVQATQAGNLDYAAATPVSQTFTVSAVPPPTASSISPVGVVAGSAATTITLTGTNFTATDMVEFGESTLTSTFVNATTLTAVIPANLLTEAGTLPLSVLDTATGEASGLLNFTVAVAPVVVFTGPTSATSDQQPMVTFQLKQPYAVPINCLLTLTFTPATTTGIDDPAVQFSSGGRTISFTVPAGLTATPAVQFQTGTVAGTVTVTLGIVADAVNVTPANVAPIVVVLPEVVPQVMTATVARTGPGTTAVLTVTMAGFSNTREVKSAVFHFTPTPGSTISNPDVTIDVTDIFATWFSDSASVAYGSSFTYTQPFNLDADPATIQSVTVTLVNGVGSSVAQTSE